jgi:predicted dehydrogenase
MKSVKMETKTTTSLNIGMIGFGFIGKLHAKAYESIPYAFPAASVTARVSTILRQNPQTDMEFLQSLGNPFVTASNTDFYAQPLDVVDICSPNRFHIEQVLEAIQNGKHIYCEKPLGINLQDAREIVAAANKTNLITHCALMMRYIPAVRQMKAIIENGGIGQPLHFRAYMNHGGYIDILRPMTWRLRHAMAGGGALTDLGIHLLDLIQFLLGKVAWVQCETRTFVPRRPKTAGNSEMETVDVDDWALCTLGLPDDACGTVEVTRVAAGAGEESGLEIHGSLGTLKMEIGHPEQLKYYDVKRKQWIDGKLDFPPAAGLRPLDGLWPPSKQSMGYMLNAHMACCFDFLQCIREQKPSALDFEAALTAQEILEAAYLSALKSGQRIQLPLP